MIASLAVVSLWDTREVRWADMLLGAWMVLAPWWRSVMKNIALTSLTLAVLVATTVPVGCSDKNKNGRNKQPAGAQRGSEPASERPSARVAWAQQRPGQRATPSLADVAERTTPGVVNIASTRVVRRDPQEIPFFNDPFFRRFFGPMPDQSPEQRQRSLGSGVLISEDGLILTNNHVVAKTDEIVVTLADRREFKAKVVGSDPRSDLAVVKLQGKVEGLQTIPFGDSDQMRLGDVVLAVGNPFGVGQTVTMGIISAKGRANMGIVDYEDFIQTDAAINPGNSGGALINLKGELVGINTAILSRTGGYMGIGFAIPSNMARPIMDSLLKHGKVIRGWLGVAIQEITPDLAKALGLEAKQGVLVSDVTAGGPAARAGFRRGDVIQKVNGETVSTPSQLQLNIARHQPGTRITIEVLRDGKKVQLSPKLEEMPGAVTGRRGGDGAEGQTTLDGLGLRELDPALRSKLQVPRSITGGVVVTEVRPGSAAAASGLRTGDVVLEANRRPVRTVDELQQTYRNASGKLVLLVYRQGSTLYLLLPGPER